MPDSPVRVRRPQAAYYQERAQRNHQIGVTVLKFFATLVVIALVVVGGYFGYNTWRLKHDISSGTDLGLGAAVPTTQDSTIDAAPVAASDGAVDVLLVGSDSRTDAQGNPLTQEEIDMLHAGDVSTTNTDTIIVARIDTKNSTVTAVSIPRDSYIKDRTFGNTKINGVYAMHKAQKAEELRAQGLTDADVEAHSTQAGRAALIEAVGSLTGVTIDHYTEVGLLGFALLTDAVGGVPVCLNTAVNEPLSGANFPAGQQTLNGSQGLSFVRQRHGLPRGDLDRITRQQVYMAALAHKVISAGTLTNPAALNDLMGAVRRSVVLDADWDVLTMLGQLKSISGSSIRFETIPVVTIDGKGDNGESVVEVNVEDVHEYFKELLGIKSTNSQNDIQAALSARVVNATTTDGLAGTVAEQLKSQGVVITDVGTSTGYGTQSVVKAHPDNVTQAQAIADKLGYPVDTGTEVDRGSVIVVVGHSASDTPPTVNSPVAPIPEGSGVGVTAEQGATCVN